MCVSQKGLSHCEFLSANAGISRAGDSFPRVLPERWEIKIHVMKVAHLYVLNLFFCGLIGRRSVRTSAPIFGAEHEGLRGKG